ncbi:glycoside hydrolase family 2 TIM barrel-domain containing protein [Flavobacterium saccharophilum]|uniref:Glycosyl hydrolases family 2 n=1 Tax=Flavobacterium saccharophilum TaxID=29534 RepID=A0A1M7JLS2_9FLAO|nr:glycoside hydrolase family 2 TIM barrel-domain containing protein [Flavobacterium saccharophilum]SHM53457.1 Glycosyl hydrolases family 2 [Flavobacterium saccharophilum]
MKKIKEKIQNQIKRPVIYAGILSFAFYSCSVQKENKNIADFNFDWNFKLEDSDNNKWSDVRLPHDWSAGFSFDSIKGEGATGYLLGGIGWYKKDFVIKKQDDTKTYILFDGVYNNSEVWLNETKLGEHPYGYSPFYYDITPSLKSDSNVIKVKVDHSRYADSRWYTGSGIYRNVKLITKNKLHVPIWGTYITTPVINSESSEVVVQVKVANDYGSDQTFVVRTEIVDSNNKKVATSEIPMTLIANKAGEVQLKTKIDNPKFWGISNPYLYIANITIVKDGKVIDETRTTFGVRTIKFDVNTGFYLNGENMKIKGVCLHHDGGLVGTAVPIDVWKRRFVKLKEAGVNAIRISHNPGSEEFLDLCDQMGFLVQDEFFDEWDNPKDKRLNTKEKSVDYITRGYGEHFQEWAERDLKATMLRDRNHASIFQWSIGNEIEWTYQRDVDATGFFNLNWDGNYFWSIPPVGPEEIKKRYESSEKEKYTLAETAQKLAKWTREMDTTRYVVANSILPSISHITGYGDAVDILGYSYRRVMYDYGHKNYPNKIIMGTENLVQWHEWKAIMERPFISGTFLWTGIDYLGESNKKWPNKGTDSGILDFAGFEKPSYHMMKSLWNDTPELYIATQTVAKSIYKIDEKSGQPIEKKEGSWKNALWVWQNVNEHWEYPANEKTIVEIYSNCDEVELFLNDISLGKKKLTDFDDHIYKWNVPYQAGELKAVGKNKSGENSISILKTPDSPAHIQLTTDKTILTADGYEVAHIVAQIVDKNNNPIKTFNPEITFNVSGDLKILGIDNGAVDNVQDFQSNSIKLSQGRCLFIVQSKKDAAGNSTILASTPNLKSNEIKIVQK